MSIDQFFGYGPNAPFATNEVFTNREAQIERCHRWLVEHSAREWPVPALMDFQRPAVNILAVAGEGGIGKSTLTRHVADLAIQGELDGLPKNRACAVLDFADPDTSSFESLLLRVRAGLGRLARSWPAFDVALALYWERKHPGESLAAFLGKGSADGRRAADQVSGTVDQLLGGFGAISVTYQVLDKLGRTVAQKARLKSLRNELPALDPILDEPDPDRMLGYMPVLLSADLERARAKRPALAVCVLDTLEIVQGLPSERGGLEDLVSRLVYLMPNVAFLAASRLPLGWHDPVRSLGLTYGGAHRWPELAGPVQVRLDGFDPVAANEYLTSRLTVEDRPAIDEAVRDRMIAGSAGSPLYLDLSASLYAQYLARGETPPPEVFGLGFPELVLRTMRDLSETDRDLLRAAALLETFDADLLQAMLPGIRRRRIDAFISRPFVRHEESVWPAYRLHENLRRSVLDCDAHTPDGWTLGERREHLERAISHLAKVALSIWDEEESASLAERSRQTVAAFLLLLRASIEHRVLPPVLADLAYSLSVAGHWQVLASLPAPEAVPELRRLSAVARLTTRGDLNAEDRYQAMYGLVGEHATPESADPFADYYRWELGTRAHVAGRLDEAIEHLSAIAADGSLIGASALFGLADNALRRGDYRQVADLMDKATDEGLDRIRVADMLGHTYIHNARFADAVRLFETTLEAAQGAGTPLWEARALRHLALALMWYDPDRTLALVPRARDLNSAVGELIGVAQCDLAASMAHALRGEHGQAADLLDAAARQYEELGATGELTPAEAIRVLQYAADGRIDQAAAIATRLAASVQGPQPECLPVWVQVTSWWAGLPAPEGAGLRLLDGTDTALQRWKEPLDRLRRLHRSLCAPLDVADRKAFIPTDRLPNDALDRAARSASASPAFDGSPVQQVGDDGIIFGERTVIKLQHRAHERLETALHLEQLRAATGIPVPRLLDHGTDPGGTWWAILERLPGTHSNHPTVEQQRALGRTLRAWHSHSPAAGLRLDDPGAVGVLLGGARRAVPRTYPALAQRFSDACDAMPMTPIHGDLAVGHNALFDGDTLTGVLDPGATEQGPPMLDLAWALAVDLPHGGSAEPLLEGYGDVDYVALNALLPLMLLRRLIDTVPLGLPDTDGQWIARYLRNNHPGVLALVEGELNL
ncbi:phosphotransferase [Actinomadura opuntiae]|uniref:phosphotransferase n=1 Tax=Actinomadura sp. OS1-43 TaxID=604315 RepID=UPI00255AD6EA|nr:aminoglycoside phosphotransferase family protein [Actinomadura sp. OS1-43]MDL4818169.1 aminoglycoside phosphotransferase family protein [Actinomadura sp. OS1-43]